MKVYGKWRYNSRDGLDTAEKIKISSHCRGMNPNHWTCTHRYTDWAIPVYVILNSDLYFVMVNNKNINKNMCYDFGIVSSKTVICKIVFESFPMCRFLFSSATWNFSAFKSEYYYAAQGTLAGIAELCFLYTRWEKMGMTTYTWCMIAQIFKSNGNIKYRNIFTHL
jgi:hypothetical protein